MNLRRLTAASGTVALAAVIYVVQVSAAAPPPKPPASATAGGDVKPIPPPGNEISDADRKELQTGVDELGKEIDALRKDLAARPNLLALLPDIQIYHNAVRYPLQYHELLDVKAARQALADGTDRVKQLRGGGPAWAGKTGPRGYVSGIDGSVQPYILVVPANTPVPDTKCRLDVSCHGRNEQLTELRFLYGKEGNAPPAGPDKYVVWLYGRYCNANKFAGEVDCLEAMADIQRRYPIDENRRLMIGFSMGGAAAWQFATHYTDLWAAASPGAGFSESQEFLRLAKTGELERTPGYEKTLWHWYDCTDYAANLFNLPTIAYAGELDGQKQASDAMLKAMEAEGLKLERIIGPKTQHAYEKGAREELYKRLDEILAKGRTAVPRKVRFTTWTLRYNRMYWVTVDGLGRHWERARADGEIAGDGIKVKTENVTGLTLEFKAGQSPFGAGSKPAVTVDGTTVPPDQTPAVGKDGAWAVHLAGSAAGGWQVVKEAGAAGEAGGLRKVHGLQGPIDDAFMEPFLIVRPTGKPLNEKVGAWCAAECDHAIDHWRKQFRGEARVKADVDVTDADIEGANLVLFGDPSSNKVLGRVAGKLPVAWGKDGVAVGGKTFEADHHVPAMVYPNPLNPKRYVVLNSGFTFREFDYMNNARQTAKLPDWAVVDVNTPVTPRGPGAAVGAGFFGERWEVQEGAGHNR